jgi:pimeloyl-ACP methyl ester carboxylesterase
MQAAYYYSNGVKLHYYKAGRGPVLFLLHPSPRSAAMMLPFANRLTEHFTVIAPDLPGYGQSPRLNQSINSVYDYLPTLHQFFTASTNEPFFIYGTATGAQVAIAYALEHAANLRHLFIDNAAHFSEEQCAQILENYFIDITPTANGSHLTNLWTHIQESCLYFPWYEKNEHNRIATELPPIEIQQTIFNDYITAGVQYADAYKAAFKHERAHNVNQLNLPTTLFVWQASPIKKYITQLTQRVNNPNVTTIETPANIAERFATMQKAIIDAL